MLPVFLAGFSIIGGVHGHVMRGFAPYCRYSSASSFSLFLRLIKSNCMPGWDTYKEGQRMPSTEDLR